MKLLPFEEQILSSNEEKIILTNQRISMNETDWGNSYNIVLFLEDLSSIETRFKSNVVFLILGCIGILSGLLFFFQGEGQESATIYTITFIAGIILLVVWRFSRRHQICISSNGGSSLNIETERMGSEQVEDFLYAVQSAKAERIRYLFSLNQASTEAFR